MRLHKMGLNSQIEEKGNHADAVSQALFAAVSRILRMLARVLLKHGVSFQAFSEIAKRAYIASAREDFSLPGRKSTVSRVAVLTGLTRKEIQRLDDTETESDAEAVMRYNRAARVVSGWARDKDFRDANGEPRALALDGENTSFSELVRRYSGDMPPRAMLDELVRVGAVQRTNDSTVLLVQHAYIPRSSDTDKLAILGTDVAALIGTIDHNLGEDGHPHFQRKVMYDNLPVEAVEQFREIGTARSQALMEYLDSWLSQHDRDNNPASEGNGRMRAGLGVYYFEENLDSGEKEQ